MAEPVLDRESGEYLTCWNGDCEENGDDDFYVPIPGQDYGRIAECYIFCSRACMEAFCRQHGLEIEIDWEPDLFWRSYPEVSLPPRFKRDRIAVATSGKRPLWQRVGIGVFFAEEDG